MTQYKSIGEQVIATFLKKNKINFVYEKKIRIADQFDKERIWYPDFYLKNYGIIIEFFGMKGDKQYDDCTKNKINLFKKRNYTLISIYPDSKEKVWQNEILDTINNIKVKKEKFIFEKKNEDKAKLILKTLKEVSGQLGRYNLSNIILGLNSKQIEKYGNYNLPTYGILQNENQEDIIKLIDNLISLKYIKKRRNSKIEITEKGCEFI
jgi:hypothetical protein